MAQSMKAVIFHGPRNISVQDRPIPQLQQDTDVLVKVQATALCGSELHTYRGHQPSDTGFIMGHEFVGIVVAAGSAVKTLSVGDKVVSPFTTSCGQCFYCLHGFSSRCSQGRLFGSPSLPGSQAEYVLVPLADGTLFKSAAETASSISDEALILMADIFPTGYYAARSAWDLTPQILSPKQDQTESSSPVVVVIGCGPVGLCAIIAAMERRPKHLFAVDSVPSRLAQAEKLGAQPLDFHSGMDTLLDRIRQVTDGRGADIIIEAVGLSPALRTAFDLVRPFGVISSIGVHNAEIPWTGSEAYNKNIRLQMGRCPVRSIFPEALQLLSKKQHLLGFMFENTMPLSDAVKGYTLFDEMKVQKVIFKPDVA